MAESKVLYESPTAPSGAAEGLDLLFKESRAIETKKAEADITKGVDLFRSGLQMKEREQAQGFAEKLEEMRQFGAREQARQNFELAKQLGLEKATAEAGAVGDIATTLAQTGQRLPGISFQGAPGEPVTAGPIQPQAADVYKDLVGRGLAELFSQAEKQRAKITPLEHGSAQTMAKELEAFDPVFASRLRAFIPGVSERSAYESAMDTAAKTVSGARARLEGFKLRNETLLEIARLRASNATEIANIKRQAAVSKESLVKLKAMQSNVQARLAALGADATTTQAEIASGMLDMASMRRAQETMRAIAAERVQLEQQLVEIGGEMNRGVGVLDPRAQQLQDINNTKRAVLGELYPNRSEDDLKPKERLRVADEVVKRLRGIK